MSASAIISHGNGQRLGRGEQAAPGGFTLLNLFMFTHTIPSQTDTHLTGALCHSHISSRFQARWDAKAFSTEKSLPLPDRASLQRRIIGAKSIPGGRMQAAP